MMESEIASNKISKHCWTGGFSNQDEGEKSQVCQSCLSSGRRTTSAAPYTDILLKILSQDTGEFSLLFDSWTRSDPMLCWECIKILSNVQKFQRMVYEAQRILSSQTVVNLNNISLSTLGTYMKQIDSFDAVFSHDCKTENNSDDADQKPPADFTEEEDCSTPEELEIKCEFINPDDEDHYNDCDDKITGEQLDISIDINMLKKIIPSIQEQSSKPKEKKRYHTEKREQYEIIYLEENTTNYCKFKADAFDFERVLEQERKHFLLNRKPKYACVTCLIGFTNGQTYNEHQILVHSTNHKWKCSICGFSFSRKNLLKKHSKCHEHLYKCNICLQECTSYPKIKKHMEKKHDKKYKCRECGTLCLSRSDVKVHFRKMHREFICDHCGKKFNVKRAIRAHINQVHGNRFCKKCNKTFLHVKSYLNHMRAQHSYTPSEATYCVECNLSFPNLLKFRQHLQSAVVHKKPVQKSIPCPVCNKIYRKLSTMKNHYRLVHEQNTKWRCEKCDKCYLNGFRLRQHIRSFHEKIPLPKDKLCPHCGRAFAQKRTLVHHIRTHTGERPYACEYCSSRFAQRTALFTHMRNIHKTQVKPKNT